MSCYLRTTPCSNKALATPSSCEDPQRAEWTCDGRSFLFDDTIPFQGIQVLGYFAVSIYCRVVNYEFAKRMRKGRTKDLLTKMKSKLQADASSSDFQRMRGQKDSMADKRHSSVTAGMSLFLILERQCARLSREFNSLREKLNRTLGNKPLSEKWNIYEQSAFSSCKRVAERYKNKNFDPQKRTEFLAKLIFNNVWELNQFDCSIK